MTNQNSNEYTPASRHTASPQSMRRMKRVSKREQKRRLKLSILAISIVMMLLVGGLGYSTFNLYEEQRHYAAEIDKLNQAIQDQDALTDELELKKRQVESDKFIESEARNKLNMVYGNEILIKKKN